MTGAIEINLNDIEIDPESLEGVMDVSDNPQVLEYLKFKHMHQENFLRDVANKGLKKPERTTQPPPPPQPQRRSMNY
ncbi:uncharacterized protein KQ657_001889 [Scheffersomyces spartinae]|uniref:Uncharacterized protein n=1 Tax=Scheffersomyces spartinae TaxID=45513 RepID=A0A9P8AGC1_9ASCO|nr:uncharacterized protein KQ657_001889 [Scheffersomyces spartinae]KAG7192175.1 hypothetical protein KQ657_001889 [Scheffersomyces spartinae]